ncbi:GPR1/FUN34/yaaH family-domain-containing protein [Suillus paluster]|uniref:GPR1/FUN34/yaaH family-domain-containing protein n=1 Tax=Suillus paluster TaxID=48578 RepID=UPI001B8754F5|nr:GPR1/FUN34/yaaH family-domain-containing protein [Suillus paluster]KAG1750531.1 GPR1/FUN34/yaaH family-domain-containing protein [Suillus paluster]
MFSNHSTEKEDLNNSYSIHTLRMNTLEPPAPPAPQMQPYKSTFGNPAPLGLISYGTGFLFSSIMTLASKSVGSPNLVMVLATFYCGITLTLVGMWEMFLGNTFSATLFTTYGGFNFSYGAIFLPQVGIAAAYTVDGVVGQGYFNAIGIYLAVWTLVTFLFFLGTLRTTIPTIVTLGFSVCALVCLSLNAFTGNPHLATAGGAMGVIASFGAYYSAFSLFWTQQTTLSFIRLPPLAIAPLDV